MAFSSIQWHLYLSITSTKFKYQLDIALNSHPYYHVNSTGIKELLIEWNKLWWRLAVMYFGVKTVMFRTPSRNSLRTVLFNRRTLMPMMQTNSHFSSSWLLILVQLPVATPTALPRSQNASMSWGTSQQCSLICMVIEMPVPGYL